MNQQPNVFYSDNYLNNCIRARKFEQEGKWQEARDLRNALGHKSDVEAIDLIIESTRIGDEYRSLVKDAYKKHERRELNNNELHEILTNSWNEVRRKYSKP